MGKFKKELDASERAAKLLTASGKLTGWVTRGKILKSMSSDQKATSEVINTLLVYGWMKMRKSGGTIVYGISTKEPVQHANLKEMELKYTNQLLVLKRNQKRTRTIRRAVGRRVFKQKAITYTSTKWNLFEKWCSSLFSRSK